MGVAGNAPTAVAVTANRADITAKLGRHAGLPLRYYIYNMARFPLTVLLFPYVISPNIP
jgi:hypothetical protein